MDLSDWRDAVVVVAGIFAILIALVRLAIAAGTLYFGAKGIRLAHRFMDKNVKQYMDKGLEISKKVEERTARLPGAPGAGRGIAEVVGTVQELREMDPPFRSRKKTWRPL